MTRLFAYVHLDIVRNKIRKLIIIINSKKYYDFHCDYAMIHIITRNTLTAYLEHSCYQPYKYCRSCSVRNRCCFVR